MIQNNYFSDNEDIQLHFSTLIPWEEIIQECEDNFSDYQEYQKTGNPNLEMSPSNTAECLDIYKQVLSSYGNFSGMEVSQLARSFDAEGLKFENGKVIHPKKMEELVHKFHNAGIVPIAFHRKYGGLGLPHTIKTLVLEIANRADTSFTIAVGSMSLAAILQDIASEEQKMRILSKIVREKYSVTMGLTEPDFGSDLPSVRTTATLKEGKWYINGTKRFQTMACGVNGLPAAILCLARTGKDTGGAKGLSFFWVESKDYEVVGIEKKMGIKASATCEVIFENSPAELLGEQGYGLTRYVMGMLNGARMSVASEGLGVATAAYQEAKKYASERIQFGKPLDAIPAVKRMLDKMEREIASMRCLALEGARTVDMYHWRTLRAKEQGTDEKKLRQDDHVRYWNSVSTVITPLAKYYNAEMANKVCYDAIQVFGGSGFCEDFDVARFYRDIRIATIWDGTSQIQVNAAIGGIVNGFMGNGAFGEYISNEMKTFSPSPELQEILQQVKTLVTDYKALPTSQLKDTYSVEVVHATVRLLNGILLERTETKLKAEQKEYRKKLRQEYNIESQSQIIGFITLVKKVNC
jgi:alkylation response protein AidB-like acyl-CoA dehydrogenase